jgi:hypothetical protein
MRCCSPRTLTCSTAADMLPYSWCSWGGAPPRDCSLPSTPLKMAHGRSRGAHKLQHGICAHDRHAHGERTLLCKQNRSNRLLKYYLTTKEMSLISLPVAIPNTCNIVLTAMEDGRFGLAKASSPKLRIGARQEVSGAGCEQRQVIVLETLLIHEQFKISPFTVAFAGSVGHHELWDEQFLNEIVSVCF